MTGGEGLAYAFAKRCGVVVLSLGEQACVGLREGADPIALTEARRVLGRPLHVQPLSRSAFDKRLSETYAAGGLTAASGAQALEMSGELGSLSDHIPAAADLLDASDDAPVIRMINGLIAEAVRQGASDIHIEPYESDLVVRLRIDGQLRETARLPARLAPLIVSRVKVMARLDIAERRIPQDGRISLALGGKSVDVRVSTLPSRAGERVVLRILDKDQASLPMDQLGMSPEVLAAFQTALREPNGIVLVTGPTGSGKTTSLYAGLAALNETARNILTIEDPVEYAVEGVGQTGVNSKVGMTFAAGLRAILRQDPDVVMVGEIRDAETAQIAVQASLTGHLVLTSVHTNDAVGAVTRLRDMGIEPFLLASSLRLVLAQRLVRRLCPHCRVQEPAGGAASRLLRLKPGQPIWRAGACEVCKGTGFAGRIGIYEAMPVTAQVRALIGEGATEAALAAAAFRDGETLADAARACVLAGLTTPEEALRVTRLEPGEHGAV